MRKRVGLFGVLCLIGPMLAASGAVALENEEVVQGILRGMVDDFREDPYAEGLELTIGIHVKDVGEWFLEIAGPEAIALTKGPLSVPAPYYVTDLQTLQRIDRGELSIMTAMGRAKMTDPAPMNYGFANDYRLTPETMATLLPFTFHFWTKGQPEIVRFGELSQARVIHGAYSTLFYYQAGLRTSYYRLEKGQHINADETEQTNPFPSLFLFIGGDLECRIGGREMGVSGKQAILVPAGVSHEFWNPNETPAEFILVMFGEGA